MAAKPTTTVLAMKLLIDRKEQRVLYAEAGKDVVDFLFSLLALPLSAVTKLLTTAAASPPPPDDLPLAKLPTTTTATGAMVGSLGNLYRSVEDLDAGHVCRRDAKDSLLEPVVLHLTAAAPAPAKPSCRLFRCKGCGCSTRCYDHVTTVSGTPCPVCKGKMTKEMKLVEVEPSGGEKKSAGAAAAGEGSSSCCGGYVRDMVYTVMDDLSVAPMSTICAVTALGVSDISALQAETVEIGYKEGLALLKASLPSQTVLTDVFLGAKQSAHSWRRPRHPHVLH